MTRSTLAIGFLVSLIAGCSADTAGPGATAGGSTSSAGGNGGSSTAAGQGGGAGVVSGSGGADTSGSGGAGTSGSGGKSTGSSAGGAAGGGAGGGGGASGAVGVGGGAGIGGNAGASGGAGIDGGLGSDAGSSISGCTGKPYKLCEDFETGTAGGVPTNWTILRGYAAQRGGIGLANDDAHSGKMALKSEGMSTGMDRVQRSLASLGTTATKHWGRLFYKVKSPFPKPSSGVIHLTFAGLEGPTENRIVDTVVDTNGSHQWLFNLPDDSCCTSSPYNWKFDDAWHCAEWTVDVAAQSFRFFSDGKEVTQLAFTGRAAAKMSNYTSLGLGTIYYQAPPMPIVVWFDDLAIDDNQIGCQ